MQEYVQFAGVCKLASLILMEISDIHVALKIAEWLN